MLSGGGEKDGYWRELALRPTQSYGPYILTSLSLSLEGHRVFPLGQCGPPWLLSCCCCFCSCVVGIRFPPVSTFPLPLSLCLPLPISPSHSLLSGSFCLTWEKTWAISLRENKQTSEFDTPSRETRRREGRDISDRLDIV